MLQSVRTGSKLEWMTMRAAERVQLAPLRHVFIWLVPDVSLVTRKLIS